MKLKKTVLAFFISIIIVTAFLSMAGRATYAQSSDASDQAVLAKLEEVLNNQKSIMTDLASIKEELRIIKIRVTQSQ